MLERILEPEVMDTAEEACDYDRMDHSAVNASFAADFLAVWSGRNPVLDVGTGTAQIPIAIARRSPSIEIVAIDLADHMLALARANVAAAGFVPRIRPEKADAKGFAYPDGYFGAVISNSIIHHIPEPQFCFAEMHRVCAPGGTVFVRDLLRPADRATLEHLVNTYAAGANDHQRKMFAESLHAALTLDEVRAHVSGLGYDAGTVRQTTDRHWTWSAIR
ncbi:MAG: methyltransferase domain-containing protein [Gemmataceae bacterium]